MDSTHRFFFCLGAATNKPMPRHRKSAEVEDIEDSDDQYHSTLPRDPRDLLEGPEEEPDAMSIADSDDVPEKPAESAEAELS